MRVGLPYLVEFDWCGKAGEVFYPSNITFGLISRVEGAEGDEGIEARHEVLEKYLKESWITFNVM